MLTGCSSTGQTVSPAATDPLPMSASPVPRLATSPLLAAQANPPCSPAAVETVVREFVDALDAGASGRLESMIARTGRFQWYSTDAPGRRIDPEARDRSSLLAYFATRHDDGEQLELRRFRFNGTTNGYGNFEFDLVRRADDLPPTPYVGKGALDCQSQPPTVAVWSMAHAGV